MADTTDSEPMVPTPTTLLARGPLMLSPRLMLMPTTMADTMDSEPMVPTPMDTDPMDMLPTPTTLLARGPLMLRLMPMLTTDMAMLLPTLIEPMPMVPTPTEPDTTDTGKLPFPTKIPPESKNQNQQPQPATKT